MRWFKLTVETFESTTNPPNGSFVVMTRKEGPAGGRSGGGVYEMAPESAALISLRYSQKVEGCVGGRTTERLLVQVMCPLPYQSFDFPTLFHSLNCPFFPLSHSCDSVPVGASLNTPCSYDSQGGGGGVEGGEEDGGITTPLSASIDKMSMAK